MTIEYSIIELNARSRLSHIRFSNCQNIALIVRESTVQAKLDLWSDSVI